MEGLVRNLLVLVLLATAVIALSQTAPFTIALSAAKSQVKAGEPVDLIVVMTNISDHEVDCTSNGSNALDRNYEYDVTDENGQPVRRIEKEHHGSIGRGYALGAALRWKPAFFARPTGHIGGT